MLQLKSVNVYGVLLIAAAAFIVLSWGVIESLGSSEKSTSFYYVITAWPLSTIFLAYAIALLRNKLNRLDVIAFDEENIVIRAPFKRKIPVSSVKSVRLKSQNTIFGLAHHIYIDTDTGIKTVPLNALRGSGGEIISFIQKNVEVGRVGRVGG